MAHRPQQRNQNRGGQGHGHGQQPEPCPQGVTKDAMRAISAPYNFVPLADWVHTPSWGPQVSHDHPFRDGLSGEIAYTLTATSPLLVGGTQRKATNDAPGEVRPFKLPNGRYAIAGSSLKGMIRSVIEIAAFGRMARVDDARPGLRDISGRFVQKSYTDKVRDKVQTGFLRACSDGEQEIIPCQMARLNHRDLEATFNVPAPIFPTRKTVREKHDRWTQLCNAQGWHPERLSFDLIGYEAKNFGSGRHIGFPVFTGQISDSTKPKGKYKDFIFYDPDATKPIRVPTDVWRDFLLIHGDEEKRNDGMSWPGYWRERFHRGKDIPVFYLQDGDYLRIGLAYMPKLAGDYSIHDLIDKASPAHRQDPGAEHGYDLADLLFGAVNPSKQTDSLRGRVSFETAEATGALTERQQPDTILNGPKPTYFPNYLTQKADQARGTMTGAQYATYIDNGEKPPTARGFKRYPARPDAMTKAQPLTGEQQGNNNVKVRLHTLDNAQFKGRIVFHNLKPAELGALLWALTWDQKPELRHGLGMGKPFGFGQVRIDIDASSSLIPNDPNQAVATIDADAVRTLIDAFKREMEDAAGTHGGWEGSMQIANLLAMADPAAAVDWARDGRELRHMHLIAKCRQPVRPDGANEFHWAKQNPPGPFILADYATATGWAFNWRQEVKARTEAQEKKEAERRAEEEARVRGEQTAGMSPDEAALFTLEQDQPWQDNGQFVQAMMAFLDEYATPSGATLNRLCSLIDGRLPNLLADPHAKQGKKAKPVFKPTQIALAERVLTLRSST